MFTGILLVVSIIAVFKWVHYFITVKILKTYFKKLNIPPPTDEEEEKIFNQLTKFLSKR